MGDRFDYVFDFGDGWEHVCTVLRDRVDPKKGSGIGVVRAGGFRSTSGSA